MQAGVEVIAQLGSEYVVAGRKQLSEEMYVDRSLDGGSQVVEQGHQLSHARFELACGTARSIRREHRSTDPLDPGGRRVEHLHAAREAISGTPSGHQTREHGRRVEHLRLEGAAGRLGGRCGAIGARHKRGLRANGTTRRPHKLVRILVRRRYRSDANIDPASVEPSERSVLVESTRRLLTGLIRIEGEDERSGRRAREQRRDCELELEIGQSGAQARNSIPATESAQAHPKLNQ